MSKILLLLALLVFSVPVLAEDGIPDNCETTDGEYYRPNTFVRFTDTYELVLVDWTTGDTLQQIAPITLPGTAQRITGWSPNCQYVSIALGMPNDQNVMIWRTEVWDVLSSTQLAEFVDARRIPHPMTWSLESEFILVESRNGAFVWSLATRQAVILSSSADGNARTFRPDTVQWDTTNRTISGLLTFEPLGTAIYHLDTGELLAISDEWGRALDVSAYGNRFARATDEPYPCEPSYRRAFPRGLDVQYQPQHQRIAIIDEGTRELFKVVENDLAIDSFGVVTYSPTCRYLVANIYRPDSDYESVIWDLWRERPIRIATFESRAWRFYNLYWSPTDEHVVIQFHNRVDLIDLSTGEAFRLTPETISDCQRHGKGCSGRIFSFTFIEWHLPEQFVRLELVTGYYVDYLLSDGTPINVLNRDGQPADMQQATTVIERLQSPTGCRNDIYYHPTDQRLAIRDWVKTGTHSNYRRTLRGSLY